MTTYSREYLNSLKKEADLKQYNDKLNEIVSNISKAILFSATKGSKEFTVKIKIIPQSMREVNTGTFSWGPDTFVVYDIEMIHQVINKLKIQFFDSDIKYVESKDLSGNILTSVIRVNWDEITLDNIESHTQKRIQDENVKNGLARRKRIVDETSNKIKELEEQIAIKRDLINKLTGHY